MLPIYIISLARDVERRKVISSKLSSLNIAFEFVDAVYGKDLSQEELNKINFTDVKLRKGYAPISGEIGCTLSHIKTYQLMLSRAQPWACVLEDDAILDENFQDFYENFSAATSAKMNMNYLYILGGQDGLIQSNYIAKSYWYKCKVGKQVFHRTIHSEREIFRTCCYLVSDTMAKNLIDLASKEFFVADEWAYFLQRGIIQEIYLADIVHHPLDLKDSLLEQERKLAIYTRTQEPVHASGLLHIIKQGIRRLDSFKFRSKVRHLVYIIRAKMRAAYI